MIRKNDIISLSKLHGLRPWQEEKRYIVEPDKLFYGIITQSLLIYTREKPTVML